MSIFSTRSNKSVCLASITANRRNGVTQIARLFENLRHPALADGESDDAASIPLTILIAARRLPGNQAGDVMNSR
jgi:hypothetical protein